MHCLVQSIRSPNLPGYKIKSLSVGKTASVVDYCEKTMAMELIQDRPVGNVSIAHCTTLHSLRIVLIFK